MSTHNICFHREIKKNIMWIFEAILNESKLQQNVLFHENMLWYLFRIL